MNGETSRCDATRALIIAEIRRIAGARGGNPPGWHVFGQITGLPRSSWYGKFWSRWSDAVREAGFAANQRKARYDDEYMLAKFAELARHLGRIPTSMDLALCRRNGGTVPNHGIFTRHFGRKRELLARLRAWAAVNPDAADIAAMIPQADAAAPAATARDADGWVYLLRSQNRFKIGCSKALEQRVRRIQKMAPESALVHSIETDDPAGIESYWHRRFAAKRLNGEWFRLADADVAAFRRRKFQ